MKLLTVSVFTNIVFLVLVNVVSTQMYNKSINWHHYANNQPCTQAMAKADFGSVTGWRDDRARISNGTLRITLENNTVTEPSGLVSKTLVPDGTAYQLDFDVRFDNEFDWSRGGKVGFGFGIGNSNTGCNLPLDGAGGSLRIMWYNNPTTKRVYFHPYLYYYGMAGPCGSDFNLTYPTTGSIEKDKWYRVHMSIKSNIDSNFDGHVQIKINNQTLIDQNMRWTTNNTKRFINRFLFHTFRGGKGDQWKSPVNDYIYYDNLNVQQLSSI